MMEQEEAKQEPISPLPVLPRLDRLDRLLQLLEEKHGLSSSSGLNTESKEENCKTLSSALEEVHQRGTLMDRLALLENRIQQLSLDMEEGNTSRSSSSTVPVSNKFGDHLLIREEACSEARVLEKMEMKKERKRRRKVNRGWMGLFRMGC